MLSDEKNIPQNMRSFSLRAENYFSSYRFSPGTCKCGVDSNITEFKKDDNLWCCKSTRDDCTKEFSILGLLSAVNCIGHPIPLTQQCHDGDISTPRCNYYPGDKNRNEYAKRAFLDVCQDMDVSIDGRRTLFHFFYI